MNKRSLAFGNMLKDKIEKKYGVTTYRFGVLFRLASVWVGVHYSKYNKRFCINLIPFVTFWIVKPGGKTP